METGSRLFTARWECYGKTGSHLVDAMGRDYMISCWDGTGRKTIPGLEQVGESVGNTVGKWVGNTVGKWVGSIVGNTVGKRIRECGL